MAEVSAKSNLLKRMQVRQVERSIHKTVSDTHEQDRIYADVITNFVQNSGCIVCISDDSDFSELLRDVLCTGIGIPAETLKIESSADMLIRMVRNFVSDGRVPLCLIEHKLKNRDMTYLLKLLKNGYPEIKSILISRETSQQRFVLMHESGVDNFVIKPINAQALQERLALTIKPQGKVGRQLDWARSLLHQGEYLKALEVCRQALDVKSNASATLLLIGDIYRAMKQFDKACEAYENASRTSSVFIEPLIRLAEVYGLTGKTSRQLECLERLDEMSPLNLERKLQIGELYVKMRRPDKARTIFDQAMSLSNREAKDYVAGVAFRVATIYTEQDPETAASFLQRGLDAKKGFWSKEDIVTFNRLGLLLRRAGKWNEAVQEYIKALDVSPNDETLHYNLSMAYLEGKNYEAARASTLKALAISPELPKRSANIASNLATVFVQTGDKMHALPLLKQALEHDPDNARVKELLHQVGQI